jgi:hypothetical protein
VLDVVARRLDRDPERLGDLRSDAGFLGAASGPPATAKKKERRFATPLSTSKIYGTKGLKQAPGRAA